MVIVPAFILGADRGRSEAGGLRDPRKLRERKQHLIQNLKSAHFLTSRPYPC